MVIGTVGLAVQEGSADAKGAEQLLGCVASRINGALAENGRPLLSELPT